MRDLLALTDEAIATLSYTVDGDKTELHLGARNTLRVLRAWNVHLLRVHDLRAVDWSDTNLINTTEYDLYITQEYKPNASVVLAAVNNTRENNNYNNNCYRNTTNINPPDLKRKKRPKTH